ncbi:flagellar hook-basal body complex protein [Clostridium septicum]|uniref:flagellar hook-basal body complex protein n=2 Tax=Clostridium TaxID=1485 RepID=UPI0036F47EC4
MLRSMYSGISGMKVNQTKLDVIGNNISNVGTTSFKSSRARFSDMLSQNMSSAMAPSKNQGGVNANQVGLGVQLASIDSVMTQGNLQPTGRSLDIAIDGDGFFMVSKGPSIYGESLEVNHRAGAHNITQQSLANSDSEIMYSRDGSFILDEQGNLLTGSGYRVLGYSLTNDDSAKEATGKQPTLVSTAGLDFRFGPGSQLNGYKVVLGDIGPGTITSADVDKAEKKIILNGDFSTPGALTTTQIESAINKGVSSAGFSQQMFVSGKPVSIPDLASERVAGGADATAPGTVSIGGFAFQLSEGSELNGYSFEIGKIGTGTPTKVEINKNTKKIKIDADFVTNGALSGNVLKDSINSVLSANGFKQTVVNFSGSPMNISQVYGQTDTSGSVAKAPTAKVTDGVGKDKTGESFGGLTLTFENGAGLNGYKIKFGDKSSGISTKVSLNKNDKIITISADFAKMPTIKDEIKTAFNNELSKNGITNAKLKEITGTYQEDKSGNLLVLSDGSDLKSPKSIDVAGLTVTLPKGETYNGYSIEIVDVKSPTLTVKKDDTNKKILISGDFVTPNEVTAQKLAEEINKELKISLTEANKVLVSGNPKVFTGLNSQVIDGGTDLQTAGSVNIAGMELELTPGASLNGYKIQIGKVNAGTKTSANIDTTNKTIVINADLVSGSGTSAAMIQNVINEALQSKGINQAIKVSNQPTQISGIESAVTGGGTPVQSLNEDGSINFVDGTKDLKSYDGNLKTLKIPDKVRIPGTDQELRVKTYTIDKNGIINGVLEDGRVAALGQIAMASFKNPEGLTKLGGNLYNSSVNSGEAVIKSGVGTLNDDNSKGYGSNLQGMLEMSNVDLAEQFTDMIVSSRAFQASGKMITTGDEILQDIINLKR